MKFLAVVSLWTLLASLSVLGAAGANSAEDDLKDYVLAVLENIRSEMTTGIPGMSIPPLEPFQLKDQIFNINNPSAAVIFELPELKIVGLSTFKADVDVQLGRMGVEVDLGFTHIKGSGKYKLDGKIMKIFPVYGHGDVRLDLALPRIVMAAQLGTNGEDLSITVTKLDISWSNLNVHLGNFLGGGSLARVLEMMLPSLSKKMLTTFNPQILDGISGLINGAISEHTGKTEIRELIKSIFGAYRQYHDQRQLSRNV